MFLVPDEPLVCCRPKLVQFKISSGFEKTKGKKKNNTKPPDRPPLWENSKERQPIEEGPNQLLGIFCAVTRSPKDKSLPSWGLYSSRLEKGRY